MRTGVNVTVLWNRLEEQELAIVLLSGEGTRMGRPEWRNDFPLYVPFEF